MSLSKGIVAERWRHRNLVCFTTSRTYFHKTHFSLNSLTRPYGQTSDRELYAVNIIFTINQTSDGCRKNKASLHTARERVSQLGQRCANVPSVVHYFLHCTGPVSLSLHGIIGCHAFLASLGFTEKQQHCTRHYVISAPVQTPGVGGLEGWETSKHVLDTFTVTWKRQQTSGDREEEEI